MKRSRNSTKQVVVSKVLSLFCLCLLVVITITSVAVVDGFSSSSSSSPRLTSPLSAVTATKESSSAASTKLWSSTNDDVVDRDTVLPNGLTRRQAAELAVAGIGLGVSFLGTREVEPTDYGLWGILPVGTYKSKKTIRKEIVPNKIWTFETKFGILNVQVPLRMTVVKLSDGGLFIYNPVGRLSTLRDFYVYY